MLDIKRVRGAEPKETEAKAVPSAVVGDGASVKRRGSLLPRGGRSWVLESA